MTHILSSATTLHFGPAHPAAHGVLRCMLGLVGEYVVACCITLGLLHRGTERLVEYRSPLQCVGYMDRMDYVSMLCSELCYAELLESTLSVSIGSTTSSLRIILAELTRIENHLLNIACHAGDLGCLVALLWLFEDREQLYDMMSTLTGARLHSGAIIPGGVRIPSTSVSSCYGIELLTTTSGRLDTLLTSLLLHRVWGCRLSTVGILEGMHHTLCSGVMVRACGVAWDARVVTPSLSYTVAPVPIVYGSAGDSMDRILCRVGECIASSSIVCTLLVASSSTHSSSIMDNSISLSGVLSSFIQYVAQAVSSPVLHNIEAPKGELLMVLVWGEERAWRCRIRCGDQIHCMLLAALLDGVAIADVVMLVGTVDVVFGSVDT
nr:NADH dehydrogenase subunit 7 [Rhynchopus humris]